VLINNENKMNKLIVIVFTIFLTTFISCQKDDEAKSDVPKEFIYNFQTNSEDWIGDFADYPNQLNIENYNLEFSYTKLPEPLNVNKGALKQSGTNRSDDLFMFIKKKFNGLLPNKNYNISIEIEFATNAASGGVGVGGAPGEGVAIKAGASTFEPLKVIDNSDNWYRMNLDKGNQQIGGNDMKKIGDFSNGTDLYTYKLKTLKTISPLNIKSNSNGEIWLIIGTDSGFESTTTIYYNLIKVNIE
jgi:hypothetical protein